MQRDVFLIRPAGAPSPRPSSIAGFGVDTITFAGTLEAKLQAAREAGFEQVMLSARDVVGHPQGLQAAIARVRDSGLRVTGFQVLRDFEGLSGHLHANKVEVAKQMIGMARDLGAKVLLACSSTSQHATGERSALVRDLRKLAMLALPCGIRVAYEALSWGRHVNGVDSAWSLVEEADVPNLGLGVDSYHIFATGTPLQALELIDPAKIFLVQLADFMWQETPTFQDRMETARHYRVFPGEGVHSQALATLVRQLDAIGYRGDYSFEVFNDDYQQLPLPFVAGRAHTSALWLAEEVLRRGLPPRLRA